MELSESRGVRVCHWVWMPNHYHLLAEGGFNAVMSMVSSMQQRYAQYHHARHATTGKFWQGRFGSKPVEMGRYLRDCGLYIERNPVRAGLAEFAWDFPWSSAGFYVMGRKDGLTRENTHLFPSEITAEHRREYRRALGSGESDEAMRLAMGKTAIGSPEFLAGFHQVHGRPKKTRGRPGTEFMCK